MQPRAKTYVRAGRRSLCEARLRFSGRLRRCSISSESWYGRVPGKSPVYYANARLGNALADYIVQNHFDAVVTTHLYPAETLTWMKQKGRLTIPCVAIATDYACIPFWEETNCDDYVVPHKDLIPEFASCGIPKEKLLPLGIPVRPAFARPASKEDVRRHLGLPEECSAVSRHERQYGIRQSASARA